MHSSCTDRPMYTGAPMFGFAPPFAGPMMGHHPHHDAHGFCHSCCHPRSHCMCGHRQCRKEAKELVVRADAESTDKPQAIDATPALSLIRARLDIRPEAAAAAAAAAPVPEVLAGYSMGTAFIGGGCCVHLSIEYMADNPKKPAVVAVEIGDSEGTMMMWARTEPAGTPYQIKEGIMTTKPGAKLLVVVNNATARVRWCEIFSC